MSIPQELLDSGADQNLREYFGLELSAIPAVKDRNGKRVPPLILAYLLTVHDVVLNYQTDAVDEYKKPDLLPEAAEIIVQLDPDSFQNCLGRLAKKNLTGIGRNKKMFLSYPICRYANEALMEALTDAAICWRNSNSEWDTPSFCTFLRASLYSSTRAGALFVDYAGKLQEYADLRNTTEDVVRDHIMFPNLQNEKEVARFTENRVNSLFQDFLSGRPLPAQDWVTAYTQNPVLKVIAGSLVWSQGRCTFLLKDGKPVDSSGNPYPIGAAPVVLAHPMEMEERDIVAWKKYLTTHDLKQPFTQMWEPVMDFSTVKKERYAEIALPGFCFQNQKKHGIQFCIVERGGSDFAYLDLTDCALGAHRLPSVDKRTMKVRGDVQIKEFLYSKKSRASNHIIGLLDKWAVYSRILKDDASIADQLPQFTLAQIEEFLKLAMENNCTSCTAALLEFKNANFAGFDPLAEFTLEL